MLDETDAVLNLQNRVMALYAAELASISLLKTLDNWAASDAACECAKALVGQLRIEVETAEQMVRAAARMVG